MNWPLYLWLTFVELVRSPVILFLVGGLGFGWTGGVWWGARQAHRRMQPVFDLATRIARVEERKSLGAAELEAIARAWGNDELVPLPQSPPVAADEAANLMDHVIAWLVKHPERSDG